MAATAKRVVAVAVPAQALASEKATAKEAALAKVAAPAKMASSV